MEQENNLSKLLSFNDMSKSLTIQNTKLICNIARVLNNSNWSNDSFLAKYMSFICAELQKSSANGFRYPEWLILYSLYIYYYAGKKAYSILRGEEGQTRNPCLRNFLFHYRTTLKRY